MVRSFYKSDEYIDVLTSRPEIPICDLHAVYGMHDISVMVAYNINFDMDL